MNIRERIKILQESNQKGLDKAKELSLKEQEDIYKQRVYEEAKFEQFKRIIDGKKFFRIDHLRALNINYQIAIHLSAKNVGKTTELYRLIAETIKKGKKFVYGRVTVQELETEIEKFREDERSPVILLKHGTRYYFFEKTKIQSFLLDNEEAAVTYKTLLSAGIDIVGKGMTFMGSNTLGGGNYADYEMIFFDEIVSYTPKQYVNDRILYNWGCAVSTILRDKKDLTIIMMGNLQNNITSVPILTYYGINIADNLRIIRRTMGEGKEPCTILYVNSGSLYSSSLKNQASVAHHASLDDRLFMEHNKIINSNIRILNSSVVSDMKPLCACAMEYVDDFYVLELRGYEPEEWEIDQDQYFALCVYPMSITTALSTEIFTHDPVTSNRFSNTTYKKNLRSIYKFIYKLFVGNMLYFDNVASMDIGSRCLEEIVSRYLDATDPKRYRP